MRTADIHRGFLFMLKGSVIALEQTGTEQTNTKKRKLNLKLISE